MILDWLKPSAITDLAQLLSGIRPVIRTEVAVVRPEGVIHRFAWQIECFARIDPQGFVTLSRSDTLSRRVLALDRQPGNHTYRLGLLLGYPRCCCRAAARVGDHGLDAWAAEIGARPFRGRFWMIDPSHYRRGTALISHIPCSERCLPSLAMARHLAERLPKETGLWPGLAGRIARFGCRRMLRRQI